MTLAVRFKCYNYKWANFNFNFLALRHQRYINGHLRISGRIDGWGGWRIFLFTTTDTTVCIYIIVLLVVCSWSACRCTRYYTIDNTGCWLRVIYVIVIVCGWNTFPWSNIQSPLLLYTFLSTMLNVTQTVQNSYWYSISNFAIIYRLWTPDHIKNIILVKGICPTFTESSVSWHKWLVSGYLEVVSVV